MNALSERLKEDVGGVCSLLRKSLRYVIATLLVAYLRMP